MVKRLLALFLLVNVVGVAANLPRIIEALDGAEVSATVTRWVVGVSTATGDLLAEASEDPLTPEDVAQIQEDLRNDTLEDPLDDESVAALVDLWRVLDEAGAQLQADDLRELLLDEGIDPVTDAAVDPAAEPTGEPTAGSSLLRDGLATLEEQGRSALDALGGDAP